MPRRRALPALALTAALALSACGTSSAEPPDGRVRTVAAFYPLHFLLQRVGGPGVVVTDLTRPGAEPHDLELTARQVGSLEQADLVVYERGFQPAVDEGVDQQARDRALDVAGVTPLREGYAAIEDGELEADTGSDPHVWLDPTLMSTLAGAVADRLSAVEPAAAAGFRERAAALQGELAALDGAYRTGLAQCARTDVVTSHNAFGYLTERYGLTQVGITGLVPEEEPTPGRLADVARLARERGVTTVFFETLVSPRTAESLAREVGAQARVLDPVESAPEDGDYLRAMRGNLAALRTALGCA